MPLFPKQARALEVFKEKPGFLIFARDEGEKGAKTYGVGDLQEIQKALALVGGDGHMSELIPNGIPCRIYMDLDSKGEEADAMRKDSERWETRLSELLREFFREEKLLDLTRYTCDFRFLRSHALNVFSLHLILVILEIILEREEETLWGNNFQVGALVRRFLKWSERLQDPEDQKLIACIDGAVYTSNRLLRMAENSKNKSGPKRVLVGDRGKDIGFYLVCPPYAGAGAFPVFPPVLEWDGEVPQSGQNLGKRSSSILSLKASKTPKIGDQNISILDDGIWRAHNVVQRFMLQNSKGKTSPPNLLTIKGPTAWIQNPIRTFCRVIGGEHKSNGTYLFFKIDGVVIEHRCMDEDCQKRASVEGWPQLIPEEETRDFFEFLVHFYRESASESQTWNLPEDPHLWTSEDREILERMMKHPNPAQVVISFWETLSTTV